MSDSESAREPSANQLLNYANKNKDKKFISSTSSGDPIPNINTSLTVGNKGPILLQDSVLLEELSHFARERIPERVVHAKGAGAFGYFEVTHDITQYTAAKVFSQIGKRTPIAVRFSQVTGELGAADTVRDVRGFAIKFYTEDGIWDLVGNNTPIFFIRDAMLFPSLIHVFKRNPVTHVKDWDMFWDFMTLRPESTHQLIIFFSDRGIPASYSNMNGYGSHTFGLVNAHGTFYYCKFHYKTDQGIKTLLPADATRIAGEDPDYLLRDLYNSISNENPPSWTFYIQIMTPQQVTSQSFDPFDITKVWPQDEFPLIPVGKFVLDRTQSNYFAEIEQLSFNPADMVPGIEPSPDRLLQGRLFNYGDTARYRLGVNHNQLPVNSPPGWARNYLRDGFMVYNNQGGAPNYHPNSFGGPVSSARALALSPSYNLSGAIGRFDDGGDEYQNYQQASVLYQKVMNENERERLAQNIVSTLKLAAKFLQTKAVQMFGKVDSALGAKVQNGLNAQQQKHAIL